MTSWASRASLGCLCLVAACGGGGGGTTVADPPTATTAAEPRLLLPLDVEVDADGRVYVADAELHQVLRFDPASGETEVVAGTGEAGSAGDGGPAVDAQISEPTGLALADDGTLYLSDFPENRVRRVAPDGTISTVAELIAPTEVALDAPARRLAVPLIGHVVFRIDLRTGKAVRIAGSGNAETTGDGGPARAAHVESPHGAAYDADGNLFIPDGSYIRRIEEKTGVITTIAGTGVPENSGDGGPALEAGLIPVKLFFGPDGALYVVGGDPTGGTVRRIVPEGTISTVVGNGFIGENGDGGPATEAGIQPSGAALAPDGSLIVVQIEPEPSVRRVDPETGIITTIIR